MGAAKHESGGVTVQIQVNGVEVPAVAVSADEVKEPVLVEEKPEQPYSKDKLLKEESSDAS